MILKRPLPKPIAEFIAGEARSPRDRNTLARVALYMWHKYQWELIPFEEPIEISAEHWRNAIGTHYLSYLKRFKAAGIIQPVRRPDGREFYSPPPDGADADRLGLCKRYFFSPQAVFSEPAIVEYNEAAKKRFSGEYAVRASVRILSKLTLTLDARKIAPYVRDLVTPEYIRERLMIGEEIPPGHYYYSFVGRDGKARPSAKTPRSRENLLEIAERNGAELLLYRERAYIAEAGPFIRRRVEQTRASYIESLLRLKEIRKRPNITCSRNATNRRLDSNLTNLKSGLLGLVRLDGERLVSIDLSNSQFTIMAHVIEQGLEYLAGIDAKHFTENYNLSLPETGRKTSKEPLRFRVRKGGVINRYKETISLITVTNFLGQSDKETLTTASLPSDLQEFINLTKTGQFYEKLATLMSADENREISRAEAKRAMFLTAFSAHRYNPAPKQLLARHYPSLVIFMNEFKKAMIGFYEGDGIERREARRRGNASLAVMLQTIESGLFIEGLLTKLLRAGYRVFTKHDSVLCKESDLKAVEAIVRSELDAVLGAGGYRLKVERYE